MDMDGDIDLALLVKATEAASRWVVRATVREARSDALANNRPLEADTSARLAARVNNLIDHVRRSTGGRRAPANPTLKLLVERPTPVTAEEITDKIVNEVVQGAPDFLSVEFLELGIMAARCVGRILIRSGGSLRARGTGFLMAPGLLLTNEHVLTSAEQAGQCVLEMDYEQNRLGPAKQPQVFTLVPERFFLNDRTLDYALVAVAPTSEQSIPLSTYGWLPLDGSQGKISISDKDYLNIVQHPRGEEKQVVVRNNRALDMRTANDQGADELGPFLHYEADTDKGSSGSPVLNDGWQVVALHHSGVPATDDDGNWLDKDGEVWRQGEQPVDRIRWVANEAVRVSSLVAAFDLAPLQADKRALLKEAMSAQPALSRIERATVDEKLAERDTVPDSSPRRPVRQRSSATDEPRAAAPVRTANASQARSVSLQLPLTITVSLGDWPGAPAVRAEPAPPSAALSLERLEPEDFADRDGYARNFLGVRVPMPTMKPSARFGGALVVPRPARTGDRTELRYHNYSVIMSGARRLAYVSACNLDFDAPATASRNQGRSGWRTDPRIEPRDQLDNRFYAHNDYDKGHLTRRDDTAWGDTLAEAIAANDDTFFYTNAAPQHYLFNQSDEFTDAGLDLWGDLENFISEQGAQQRMRLSIFNGPIFGSDDKPLFEALVPLGFYKIVVWKDEGEDPAALGFVLDQTDLVATLAEEAIEAGRFQVRQRKIADIEALLDIGFGKVKDWDRMAAADRNEAMGDEGIVLESLADIRL